MRRMWLAALAVVLVGCPDDGPPECVTVDTLCAPLYQPTFENVFNTTIRMTCGNQLGACHSAQGAGNMSLVDAPTAYASLLDGRVTPGDPGCSELIVRTNAPGKGYLMPPGSGPGLSAPERCGLVQWVQVGAPGPVTVAPGTAP